MEVGDLTPSSIRKGKSLRTSKSKVKGGRTQRKAVAIGDAKAPSPAVAAEIAADWY